MLIKALTVLLLSAAASAEVQEQPSDLELLQHYFSDKNGSVLEIRGWKATFDSLGSTGGDSFFASWLITISSGEQTNYRKLLVWGPPYHVEIENCSSKECSRPEEPVKNNTEKEDGPPFLTTDENGNTFEHQPMIRYGEWHKGEMPLLGNCLFKDYVFSLMYFAVRFEDCLERFERESLVKPSK